jgi:hypothetical protein
MGHQSSVAARDLPLDARPENTGMGVLLTPDGSSWKLLATRHPRMTVYTIDSSIYGTFNGVVDTPFVGAEDVKEIVDRIAAHFYDVDATSLRILKQWVHKCGMSVVPTQSINDTS